MGKVKQTRKAVDPEVQADAEWKAIVEKCGQRLRKYFGQSLIPGSPQHDKYEQIVKDQDEALEQWRTRHGVEPWRSPHYAAPEPINTRSELLTEINRRWDVAKHQRKAYGPCTEAKDAEDAAVILNFALEVAAELEGPPLPVREGDPIHDLADLCHWCKAEHGKQGELPPGAPTRSPAMPLEQFAEALTMDARTFKKHAEADWDLQPLGDNHRFWTVSHENMDTSMIARIEQHAAKLSKGRAQKMAQGRTTK